MDICYEYDVAFVLDFLLNYDVLTIIHKCNLFSNVDFICFPYK